MAAVDSSLYEKFIIESVDGSKTANIAEGVVSFNYNEDLYSPMLTAKVLVINTGNTIPVSYTHLTLPTKWWV